MCALLQVLTFLSFKEKKENRLAEALSETVHSLCKFSAKKNKAGLVDTLQGFQAKVMRSKISQVVSRQTGVSRFVVSRQTTDTCCHCSQRCHAPIYPSCTFVTCVSLFQP